MADIEITDTISIPEEEIEEHFVRASGPGGQNVNKVASAVQLRFDVISTTAIPDDVKQRVRRIAGRRMTKEGVLVIEAKRYRSQDRNREDARHRFVQVIRRALAEPRKRKRTRPPKAAKERRLEEKHHRARIKKLREPPKAKE